MKQFRIRAVGRVAAVILASAVAVIIASTTNAQNALGINFVGGSGANGMPAAMTSSENAGINPPYQNYWQNATGNSGEDTYLIASPNVHVNGSISWSAAGTYSTPITESPGDARLMKGYLDAVGQATTIQVSGLDTDFGGQTSQNVYNLVLYIDGANGGADRVARVTISGTYAGTQTVYVLDKANTDFSGTYKQVPLTSTTDEGSATPDGNYVVFSGLYDKDLTITVSGGSASDGISRGALNAIQFVFTGQAPPANPTPAPSGTPTPTPTPSATASPFPTPTATVTPSPTAPAGAPQIAGDGQPQDQDVPQGGDADFHVIVIGGGQGNSYQWQHDGQNIPGATGADYVIHNVQPSDAGNYDVVVCNQSGCTTSNNAILHVLVRSKLVNISTREFVGTDSNVLIAGFIVRGNVPKPILARALGPTLSAYFSGYLDDPVIDLRDSAGNRIDYDDDWKNGSAANSPLPPQYDREAAVMDTLPVANNSIAAFTAIEHGYQITASAPGETGIGLVEIYDLNRFVDSELVNISTRGLVGTGNYVMIGGFIIAGDYPLTVAVRAIGPSLSQLGVSGTLDDPTVELVDVQGNRIEFNDDWRNSPEAANIQSVGLAPSDDRESALIQTLNPGNYTAIVRGSNDTSGVGLVEVYKLQ